MIQESVDDIFDTQNPSIILHQVNTLGFGSTGLMLKVRRTYPELFQKYHEFCGWFKDYKHQEEVIGSFYAYPIPNTYNILCNAFTQRFITDTKYEVDFDAWALVLKKIANQIHRYANANNGMLYEIHAPSKLGVGMKAEEIDAIKSIISEFFDESDITFTYHL